MCMGCLLFNVDDSFQCDGIFYYDVWNLYGLRVVIRLDSFYLYYVFFGLYLFISLDDWLKCDLCFIYYCYFFVWCYY